MSWLSEYTKYHSINDMIDVENIYNNFEIYFFNDYEPSIFNVVDDLNDLIIDYILKEDIFMITFTYANNDLKRFSTQHIFENEIKLAHIINNDSSFLVKIEFKSIEDNLNNRLNTTIVNYKVIEIKNG